MKTYKKIVVKVGTSSLTQADDKKLARRSMLEITRQLSQLHSQGKQITLITSGAVATGRHLLRHPNVERSWPSKQMFAAIGQVELVHAWAELFGLFDIHIGQLLLTREDFSQRQRYLNTRDTLACLLHHRVIPVINENDSVSTKETRVGDNDNLAALVANAIGADLLVLLTDQEGLYTADPRRHAHAQLIKTVTHIDHTIVNLAGGASSTVGTGGMATKIEAAQVAVQCGTLTTIASALQPNVILNLVEGVSIGTSFLAENPLKESRKRWLLSKKRQGTIQVDAGAAIKIVNHGASLLPSGIMRTTSNFERGAVVQIANPDGQTIAVGMANYASQAIQILIGHHSHQFADILGYNHGPEVVHRDHMTRIKLPTEGV